MAKSFDIAAYTFQADIYCPDCIISQVEPGSTREGYSYEALLDEIAAERGIQRMDEHTFDSDDFPKVVFHDSIEESEFCGCCHEEIS